MSGEGNSTVTVLFRFVLLFWALCGFCWKKFEGLRLNTFLYFFRIRLYSECIVVKYKVLFCHRCVL